MFDSGDPCSSVLRHHPYLQYVSTVEDPANGFVQRVKDCRAVHEDCFVKFIRRGQSEVTQNVKTELMNQWALCHPHIIEWKEIFLLREYLCILMELTPGGHLLDYLRSRGPLREGRARYYFQQLILAVEYCHQKGLSNRVITLQNLFLSGTHNEVLKLCDTSLYESEKRPSRLKNSTSTICYLSPEAIKSHGNRQCDGRTADVWACGVVLYAMVTGTLPFSPPINTIHQTKDAKLHNVAIARQILKGHYTVPKGISPDLRQLFDKIFVGDPRNRITIDGIKRHPWFLKGLPLGAIEMNAQWIDKMPTRKQSMEEIERIVHKAMKETSQSKHVPL